MKISVLLCTYNSEKLIVNCLNSILNQSYKNFEILCIDGGSKDKTLEIIRNYKDKRIKILKNKNRLPEGKGNGKWLGFKKAKGEIVGIIDHDNILQSNGVFKKVIGIFKKERNLVGILGGSTHGKKDIPLVRFVSIFGGDPFFAYRSVDFLKNINDFEDKKNYQKTKMQLDNMSLTGGNCFFYMKKEVDKVGGYNQDVLLVRKLIGSGKTDLAVLKDTTKHYAEKSIKGLVKKMVLSRAYYQKGENFDYLPKTSLERKEFLKNLFFNLLIFPNLIPCLKLFKKFKDPVVFYFLPVSFIVTVSHSVNFLRNKL